MQKLFKVFIAGKYPQGEITEADLQEMARNYSPSYHEAPLTLDHKREGSALGWIDKVVAKGKELFVGFSKISDEAKQLTKEGKYKRPSIEIADYEGMGKYLRAVSLVNFPQVKGLPEMQFRTADKEALIYFSEDCELNFSENKPNKKNKDMDLKKFAEKLGLEETATADEVFAEMEKQLAAKKTKQKTSQDSAEFSEMQEKITELEDKLKFYSEELKKNTKDKATELVEKAFSEGKVKPAEKDQLIKFAESDYEGTKIILDARTPDPLFDKNKAGNVTVIDPKNAKFSDGKGGVITYEEVLKDSSIIKKRKLTNEDVEALRAESSYSGKK